MALLWGLFLFPLGVSAQEREERSSTRKNELDQEQSGTPDRVIKSLLLDSIVVFGSAITVADFEEAVLKDSLFYRAFTDLQYANYRGLYVLRATDKKQRELGTYTRDIQHKTGPQVHTSRVLRRNDTGELYTKKGKPDLLTLRMFEYLFLIEGEKPINTQVYRNEGGDGFEASIKEKLKTLIAYPGRRIEGVPFYGGRTAIFEPDIRKYYNFSYFHATYRDSIPVYRFRCSLKPEVRDKKADDLLIDEMITVFERGTFRILARYLDLTFRSPMGDCDLRMSIELDRVGPHLLVDKIDYSGFWDVPLRKPEFCTFSVRHWGWE